MRFALSAEHQQFATVLDTLLRDGEARSAARRWADGDAAPGLALWKQLAELGVTALAVPEAAGGAGAHPVDLVVAFEQLGRHAMPGPLVESIAAVPLVLAELGEHDRLAGLAEGELLASLVAPPRLPFAVDADVAGLVLRVDPDGSVGLAEQPGEQLRSIDPARRLFRPASVRPLGTAAPEALARAFELGTLACSAQLVGAGAGLLAAAVEHARTREQFGRPIGEFQAVAHQLADVHVALELARPLLYAAALSIADRTDAVARDVSAAKVASGRAARLAARASLQVHGALGYTREHDVSLWLAKVRALDASWGTPAVHRARVREALQ
jgi:alkylation response protein AidB-like acyl-CoA dehydrogenase